MRVENREQKKILVIEDDFHVRELLTLILQCEGEFSVDSCGTGEEGIVKTAFGSFDLVVSDLNLPGVSGTEMIRHLRRAQPCLPILAITGIDVEKLDAVRRAGANDALIKPFSCTEFERAVEKCLASNRNN